MTNKAGEQPTITQTEKDAAALKPCPWCGATCIVVTADNQDFAAACGFCCCFGPRNVSRTEAMAAWNTRTTSLAAQDGLELAREFLAFAKSGANFNYPAGSLQKLEQFIAKATS